MLSEAPAYFSNLELVLTVNSVLYLPCIIMILHVEREREV